MIERIPFGRTGHNSSRTIFGAAALGAMKQERADRTLELLDQYGVNHIDTAASYGESELRLKPFLATRRKDFFLATKTGQRTATGAREELHKSLERLGVDHVDLIQMHNLADDKGWQTAMSEGGALGALVDAKKEGLVKNIGVTGHGTYIAEKHSQSLRQYDFASILLPYNFIMMQQAEYRRDFWQLIDTCREKQVAIQTIKAVAKRRWRQGDEDKQFSWYMPLRGNPLQNAVRFTLSQPGFFLNTTSDASLLPAVFEAASQVIEPVEDSQMQADAEAEGIEPLFIRGVSDDVRLEDA